MGNRVGLAALLLGLMLAGGLLYYYFDIHLPQKQKEERINELKSIGLNQETAEEFDNLFNKFYPYNSTIKEFAKYFKENKELALKTFEIFKNFKSSNEFLSIAINKSNSLEFLEKYEDLVKSLNIKDLEPALELHSKNSTLFDIIYNNIKNSTSLAEMLAEKLVIEKYGEDHPSITYLIKHARRAARENDWSVDRWLKEKIEKIKTELIPFASKLFLDLNYIDKVKVLDLNSNTNIKVPISRDLINVVGNYSAAIYVLKLPMHDKQSIYLLGNATLINPDIVDFKPIIIIDVENRTHNIYSHNIPRDTWMIVHHLEKTPYVIKYPEMYLAFNKKVQQNAYDILEGLLNDPLLLAKGIKEKYSPADNIIWEKVIIPQWNYYWESLQKNRIIIFPWYNITLLRELISNEDDIKIALMYLWELYPKIGSIEKFFSKQWEHPSELRILGLEAMIYQVEKLEYAYELVTRHFQKGYDYSINPHTKFKYDYRHDFYAWIGDRGQYGLHNMQKQLLGYNIYDKNIIVIFDYTHPLSNLAKDENGVLRVDKYIVENLDAINTYLTKNYPLWDLIKLTYGVSHEYFSWDSAKYDYLFLPIAMKSLSIPHSNRGVESYHYPNIWGVEDIIFGFPDYVLKPLKEGKYGEVLIFPGNGFSCIGSPLEGIKKDVEYGKLNPVYPNLRYIEIYLPIRGEEIILFKGGRK